MRHRKQDFENLNRTTRKIQILRCEDHNYGRRHSRCNVRNRYGSVLQIPIKYRRRHSFRGKIPQKSNHRHDGDETG